MARSIVGRLLLLLPLSLGLLLGSAAMAAPAMNRQQALQALSHPQAQQRQAAVARLADLGQMADARRVAERLRDEDGDVRRLAGSALWMIWSRSGDKAIDRLFERGMRQMGEGELHAALASFDRVVRLKPAFAEGWNKRATVRFMLGDDEASLKDCHEALKRNPLHFGALSGMAHIHLRRGDTEQALQAYTRALQTNPNLEDGPAMLERLEEAVRRHGGQRT
jgi:tetratricopeptide (TPR) repeat protein